MIDYSDTQDYQENNPYNMPRCNKKVLGNMKDENKLWVIMEEFMGFRSKMCDIRTKDKMSKKSKRVKNLFLKTFKNCFLITFADYLDCLFNRNINM